MASTTKQTMTDAAHDPLPDRVRVEAVCIPCPRCGKTTMPDDIHTCTPKEGDVTMTTLHEEVQE